MAGIRFQSTPENEIPVSVPVDTVLARTESLVLWLTDVHVYSCGVEFTIQARRSESTVLLDMFGFGKPASPKSSGPFLFGVEYADGSVFTNLPGARMVDGLHGGAGRGGPLTADKTYFLQPLPPPKRWSMITAWPYFGVPESRTDLDSAVFADAAERVETLWPEPVHALVEAPDDRQQPPELELPPGGWFEWAGRRGVE